LENLNSKVNQIHYQEEKIKKNKQRITELKNRLEAKTEEINNVQTYTDDLKSNVCNFIYIIHVLFLIILYYY